MSKPWPSGCKDTASCEAHGECMYMGCRHTGKLTPDIVADAIRGAKAAAYTPPTRAATLTPERKAELEALVAKVYALRQEIIAAEKPLYPVHSLSPGLREWEALNRAQGKLVQSARELEDFIAAAEVKA